MTHRRLSLLWPLIHEFRCMVHRMFEFGALGVVQAGPEDAFAVLTKDILAARCIACESMAHADRLDALSQHRMKCLEGCFAFYGRQFRDVCVLIFLRDFPNYFVGIKFAACLKNCSFDLFVGDLHDAFNHGVSLSVPYKTCASAIQPVITSRFLACGDMAGVSASAVRAWLTPRR